MNQQITKYTNWLLLQYDHYRAETYSCLLSYWPRFDNFNNFQRFIVLNLIIIGLYLITTLVLSFSPYRIYKTFMKLLFELPPVRKYLEAELVKTKDDILKNYPQALKPKLQKIPFKAIKVAIDDTAQRQVLKGKISGSRYAMESHSKFITSLAKLFSYSNPLHVDLFPLVKQMEIEIITMTADFIGLKDENGRHCGTVNSGGTESIIMALFAYRQYYMKERGVVKPNIVMCETGHCAAIKGSNYLDIELRMVPFDSDYKMNLSRMKSAIDSQTICVYTSYPNYPFGTVDPIDVIGPYCKKRGIAVHVDMCLGGFVVPFIEKNWKLPEGITSVSADPHKYGLAAKGVSILLFSSQKYRQHQFFVTSYWPGGLYGTPGVAGSRSGVYIASAWISMMKLGRKGYEQNAKRIYDALTKLTDGFQELGFEVLSKQKTCVFSFRHKTIPINAIQNFMKGRGWGFSINQKPMSCQFSITPHNSSSSDEMIKDIKDCLAHFEKNPYPVKKSIQIAAYGTFAMIKDDGKKQYVLANVVDTFIDLER